MYSGIINILCNSSEDFLISKVSVGTKDKRFCFTDVVGFNGSVQDWSRGVKKAVRNKSLFYLSLNKKMK